jgi:hypothetical protein
MKIAGVFDDMEPEVIRGVSLKSGGPHGGEELGEEFSAYEDPRCSGKAEHRLIDILVTKVKKPMEQVDASIARSLADIMDACETAWNRFAGDPGLVRSLCAVAWAPG